MHLYSRFGLTTVAVLVYTVYILLVASLVCRRFGVAVLVCRRFGHRPLT